MGDTGARDEEEGSKASPAQTSPALAPASSPRSGTAGEGRARQKKGSHVSRARRMKELYAASEAAVHGNWRLCADSYRRAYDGSARDWELSYNCISGFTSVLQENHFTATAEDLDFL